MPAYPSREPLLSQAAFENGPAGADLSQFEYDATAPFGVRRISRAIRDGVAIEDWRFAGRPAYVVGPVHKQPTPTLIQLHSQTENRETCLEEAVYLAHFGVRTVLPSAIWDEKRFWMGAFQDPQRDYRSFVEQLVWLRRLTDWLTARPEARPEFTACAGAGMGALFAALLSGVDLRFRAFALMPGAPSFQDLAQRHQSPTSRTDAEHLPGLDPARYLRLAAPAAFLFQLAHRDRRYDRATLLNLYDSATQPKTLAWYDTDNIRDFPAAREARLEWLLGQLCSGPATG